MPFVCELLSFELRVITYFKGEKIFAYVGKSHCAAILPFKQDDGTYTYKIQDTWDSTSKKIGDYWTYKKEQNIPPPTLTVNNLKLNEKIVHPKFGEGTILKMNLSEKRNILEVNFNKYGIKKISEDWLQKNITK